ncbi:MAG TPA: response regulator transcription factor [Thermoanaerobaculia bacterium]|jgi:two-component system LytT family response regulator|nr:response regulator transcription factor [Thermoanaerobaculia bacterium]
MTNDARVVIADDEPLARRMLREHLKCVDWIGEVHEVGDGLSAIRMVDTLRPDLLFLDIRMPGTSGIAVAEQITCRPYIIFTTAFDRYAVTAFEIGALDYLLKPFGRERVLTVLARARMAMEHGIPPIAARASRVLSDSKPLSRIYVKERGRMIAIPLDRVEHFEACDDYVGICIDGRRHLLRARLHDLYARIDHTRFLRVHRSHVVNLGFITAVEPCDGSRLTIILASGARITASRSGSVQIRSAELRIRI